MPLNPTTSTTKEPLIIDTEAEKQFKWDYQSKIIHSSKPEYLTEITAAMSQYIVAHPDRQLNLHFTVLKILCEDQFGNISRELFTDLLEDQFLNAYDECGNCLLCMVVDTFKSSLTLTRETKRIDKHLFVLQELIRRGANIRITSRELFVGRESKDYGTSPAQSLIKYISTGRLDTLFLCRQIIPNEIEKIIAAIDRMLDILTQGYSIKELQALIEPLKKVHLPKVASILYRLQVGGAVTTLFFSTLPEAAKYPANKVKTLVNGDGDNSVMRRVMSYLL